jgi:2-polyprenyl-6-hydroxyphenyl methylase/3-demethylubiquinone-9 3-methyltransferase
MKALSMYRTLPLAVRLRAAMRANTCPMGPIVRRVPDQGRLLEVGCGHGLFANEAALLSPRLSVVGIDPASEPIRWAQTTVGSRSNLVFRCDRVEELGDGDFDAIAIVDVLYLVPRFSWLAFLGACRERLRPGGRLILKEVDTTPRWKFYKCLAQETISVRLLRVTLGNQLTFVPRDEMYRILNDAKFQDVTATDLGRGYSSPHILYEATRR